MGKYGRKPASPSTTSAHTKGYRWALSCHAFKLGMGSEQDAKPAAWLRLTHWTWFRHYWH